MEKPRISACLVIKPEEAVLRRCLESLKSVTDEIILVHDGLPKDGSLEIAKEYGAKIFIRDFVGEAEPHRPFSYEKATGDWVLQVDADEFLSSEAQESIPKLVATSDIDAYSFWWPMFYKDHYLTSGHYSKLYKQCLFRKSKLYMVGVVHEFPRTYGTSKNVKILLEHRHPYDNWSFRIIKEKWLKWARLQAYETKYLEQAPLYNITSAKDNIALCELRARRSFPLISLVHEVVRILGVNIRDGLLWSDPVNWKIMFSDLLNSFFLHWYLLASDDKYPLPPRVEKPTLGGFGQKVEKDQK